MIIDNIEYVEKKVFFRIYTESIDVINSEVLDPEASLSEEITRITFLKGIASIEGSPLSAVKDNSVLNSFQKVMIQIESSKNKIFPIDFEASEGRLSYYDHSMSEPTIGVYVPADTLNLIINEFKSDDVKMEIGIFANLFVSTTISEFQADHMLEKFFIVNKSSKAVLANFSTQRQIQKLDLENKEIEENDYSRVEYQELLYESKNIKDILKSQNAISKNILSDLSILKWIFIGWSVWLLFVIYNK